MNLIVLAITIILLGSVVGVSLVGKGKPPVPAAVNVPGPATVAPESTPSTFKPSFPGTLGIKVPSVPPTSKSIEPNPGNKPTTTGSGEFTYPNSSKASGDSSTFVLKSSDAPKTITDWYKNRISEAGMKATSFVQTSTNGNVLNSLVGSGNGYEVRVEIKKSSGNPEVIISVSEKSA